MIWAPHSLAPYPGQIGDLRQRQYRDSGGIEANLIPILAEGLPRDV
jgi:hypothetical protein